MIRFRLIEVKELLTRVGDLVPKKKKSVSVLGEEKSVKATKYHTNAHMAGYTTIPPV